MPVTVRRATADDAAELARVAAITFPLACPPSTTDAAKADFIATKLSREAFAGYLASPEHILLLAEADGASAGYTMLVTGDPVDPDVAAAVSTRPTVELSKVYVMPEQHGTGVAAALNTENARANRFYDKSGFRIVGAKKFRLGDLDEDDFVRELTL